MGIKEDLQKYQLYVYENRKLIPIEPIDNYNKYYMQIHHFIKQQDYRRNKKWYDERGIVQKLFLIPIALHESIHCQGIKHLTDNEFYAQYGVKRSDMLFNRKWSTY
jgi:hypothetical protein